MQPESTRGADVVVKDDPLAITYNPLNMCCLNAIYRQKHMPVAILDRTEVPAESFYLPEALRFLSERFYSRLVGPYHDPRLSYS
jgi:hypothetical protein